MQVLPSENSESWLRQIHDELKPSSKVGCVQRNCTAGTESELWGLQLTKWPSTNTSDSNIIIPPIDSLLSRV